MLRAIICIACWLFCLPDVEIDVVSVKPLLAVDVPGRVSNEIYSCGVPMTSYC